MSQIPTPFHGLSMGPQAGRMPENQTSVIPPFTDMLICAFTVACYKCRLCDTAGQKKSKCLDVNTVTAELFKFHRFGTAFPVPPLWSIL